MKLVPIIAAGLLGAVTACAASAPVAPSTPTAPGTLPQPPSRTVPEVLDVPLADPFVLRDGDGYLLVGTNARGQNVPMFRSSSLAPGSWRSVGDALPGLAAWARPGRTFAPEIVRRGAEYLLYFAARRADGELQCLGVARAAVATGPYHADPAPLLCDDADGGAIDPSPFVDGDGRLYLLWKANSNTVRRPTWIKLARLDDGGGRLAGEPIALIRNEAEWEGIDVEAPTLVRHDGRYYLFYSGAMFNTVRYAVGYAVAERIGGPYRKFAGNPLLSSDAVHGYATGHQALTVDGCGRDVLVYHAHRDAGLADKRRVRAMGLAWGAGGPQLVERAVDAPCSAS